MKTVLQLQDEIRSQVWPSGEPENLKISPVEGVLSSHDAHFQEAFAEIAKWVRCEQSGNVDIREFCQTSFRCGMTIVPAPHGIITRVMTVVGDKYCDPVTYRQVDWPEPECRGRTVLAQVGTLPDAPDLPLGFASAEAATDCKGGRARAGIWALHQGNIYLYPWIQSAEKLLIEWDGIKTLWAATDLISEDQDYRKAVKLYWQFCHERDHGSSQRAGEFKGEHAAALGDLMWQCEQRLKTRETKGCLPCHSALLCGWAEEQALPATDTGLVLANIGAFGSGDAHAAAVAELVKSWAPEAILADSPKPLVDDYDLEVGQFYEQYLKPYAGSYGAGAGDKNRFWPAPGSTDWAYSALADYQAFFSGLPNNQRYYDVCLGAVHLFVVSSDDNEEDVLVTGAKSADSIEGVWLRTKLLLSPAKWKVVMMDSAPYLTTNPDTAMRWPFKDWGADLVLSSYPRYERAVVGGLNYINNGSGGKALSGTGDAPAGVSYDATHFGAGKITVTKASLRYDFMAVDGSTVDTVTLTK